MKDGKGEEYENKGDEEDKRSGVGNAKMKNQEEFLEKNGIVEKGHWGL